MLDQIGSLSQLRNVYIYIALLFFAGLSLKSQELTAIFLGLRILSSLGFLRDVHVLIDSLTLLCTLWVIYMMRFKLKDTYMKELDNLPLYYVVSNYFLAFYSILYLSTFHICLSSLLPSTWTHISSESYIAVYVSIVTRSNALTIC